MTNMKEEWIDDKKENVNYEDTLDMEFEYGDTDEDHNKI